MSWAVLRNGTLFAAAVVLEFAVSAAVGAQLITLPVPTATIYPGSLIDSDEITDRTFVQSQVGRGYVDTKSALIGKVARRTLLPDHPIPAIAIDEVDLVTRGTSVQLVFQQAGDTPGGYYYASNRLEMAEHGGTHIDAPIHFSKGGQMLDQVPIERLVGTGVRIDVTAQCGRDRDYRVTIQDFEQWEAAHGRIPSRTIVLLDTGFARYWPSRQQYLGTELRGPEGVRALHFPGLHPEAAIWLVRDRQVKAVGIDTASIDYGQSTKFETHVALLSQNVPVFENLGDLRDLPHRGFDVIALPMKITGGTGGPLRVIAVVPTPY